MSESLEVAVLNPESAPAAPASDIDRVILDNAVTIARIADDFKGKDTLLLDMRGITTLADYFVISTASSNRQMRGISEEVHRVMKLRGCRYRGCEGEGADSLWLLYDLGDVILHVFTPDGRSMYALEDLWADAPRIDWHEPGRVPLTSDEGSDSPVE